MPFDVDRLGEMSKHHQLKWSVSLRRPETNSIERHSIRGCEDTFTFDISLIYCRNLTNRRRRQQFLRHTLGVAQSRIISRCETGGRGIRRASTRSQPGQEVFEKSLCGSRKPLCARIGILTPDHNLSMELVKQRLVHFNFHDFS